MKSNKFLAELNNKTVEQLNTELTQAKKELRKNIARIETIITIKKKA